MTRSCGSPRRDGSQLRPARRLRPGATCATSSSTRRKWCSTSRGYRRQRHAERLDELLRLSSSVLSDHANRVTHVLVEHRDRVLRDCAGRCGSSGTRARAARGAANRSPAGVSRPARYATSDAVNRGVPPWTRGTRSRSRTTASSDTGGTPDYRAASSSRLRNSSSPASPSSRHRPRQQRAARRSDQLTPPRPDHRERETLLLQLTDASQTLDVVGAVPPDATLPIGGGTRRRFWSKRIVSTETPYRRASSSTRHRVGSARSGARVRMSGNSRAITPAVEAAPSRPQLLFHTGHASRRTPSHPRSSPSQKTSIASS